jgi:hypothetical protein
MVSRRDSRREMDIGHLVELHESTKSSSRLNLSTLSDISCKFIRANRSRLGIVRVLSGTGSRYGEDKAGTLRGTKEPACDLLRREAFSPFAPFFSARARNARGSVLPPFARRRRRARAFYFLSVGAATNRGIRSDIHRFQASTTTWSSRERRPAASNGGDPKPDGFDAEARPYDLRGTSSA